MVRSYTILLFCVLIWAGNYLARQFLLSEFPPLFLSAFSLTVISVFFFIMAFVTKSFVRLQRKEIVILCLAGLIGLVANQIFLFSGLKYSTATNASLIFSLAPLITALLAAALLKEKITGRMIIGSLIAMAGIYLVLSVKGKIIFNFGDLLLLGGTATFACNLIFVRMLSKRLSATIITSYSFIIGALMFAPFVIGMDIEWTHSVQFWVFALMSVIIGQGVTTMMWNHAMNTVGAAKSAIVLNFQPLMTMLLDYWIYHNIVTVVQMIGAALVFAGVLLSTIQKGFFKKKQTGFMLTADEQAEKR